MKSSVIKRSVAIAGHKTSVSLEDAFWQDLRKIANAQQATLSNVVAEIDKKRNTEIYPQRSVCSYSTRYARLRQTGQAIQSNSDCTMVVPHPAIVQLGAASRPRGPYTSP